MNYPVLPRERAVDVLRAVRDGRELPNHAARERPCEAPFSVDCERLADELRRLQQSLPNPLPERSPKAAGFDAEAGILLHRHLGDDHPALADPDFWRHLAVVHLHDIIDWRHGGESGRAKNLENFGIRGQLVECFPYRCWMQADIAFERGAKDPYAWARVGNSDFWRSHLLRQNWARNRDVARAFLKAVYGSPSSGNPALGLDGVRRLAKELRRVSATLTLEALDANDLQSLMEELVERCK